MLQELEAAADKLGVRVSYESLSASVGHGGLCRVKGQYRVIIDKRAGQDERAATLGEALAAIDPALYDAADLPESSVELIGRFGMRRAS